MRTIERVLLLFCIVFVNSAVFAAVPVKEKPYQPPRPVLGGLHLAMSADSAELVMHHIALRRTELEVDSLKLIESDSVRIFGEPAYLQIQILHNKVRTIVINFHPLAGERYLNTRNTLNSYMERFFGMGVTTQDESVTNRRWENEDGTMEVSYTDKYTRVFARLGKR
ncbi:MAG: hypothetical protein ACHQM6_07920 [Candidatus Kapaibacterium sp.]